MKRILLILGTLAALLVIIAAIGAFSALRMSLPQLDGELPSAGISADVVIERDAAGIPTVTAANRLDLAYATGFVHGQDRFFQMDLTRRNAAGELSELFGAAALPVDRRHRFHRFRARARAIFERLSPARRQLLEDYASGVNDGLESLGARPFEYLLTQNTPVPWRAEDSILAVYTMYFQLNDERGDRDIRRGMARNVLPGEVFDWLYPAGTEWDAPMTGPAFPASPIPGPDIYDLRGTRTATEVAANARDGEPPLPGSNNWAIAGHLTSTGAAMVANDMHLGITAPNVFYRVHLRTTAAEPLQLAGVTLPGTPFLVAGSTGRIAYGNTNSYGDWTDVVEVMPGASPDHYVTPGGERRFDVFEETILVKDAEPDVLVIRETIWGPVRDDLPETDRMLAVQWIAHHPQGLTLDHLALETARDVDEALAIANRVGMPPQNFVVGDRDGNIGWTIAGSIPVRSAYDASVPADWSRSDGWTGWLPGEDYPRIVNPPSGRIWTANARVVDGNALAIIGDGGYAHGARAQQIRNGLNAVDRFSPQEMLAVQLDDRAILLSHWRGLLLEVLDDAAVRDDEDRQAFRQLAEDWVPRAATDSVGYRLVRSFRSEVRDRVFTMLMQPVIEIYGEDQALRMSNQFEGPLWSVVTERPRHLLTDNYTDWRALFLSAVDANIDYFRSEFEGELGERTWGERNTASIRHPLSRAIPALSGWLDMPREPLPGDSNLPRAQGPDFGASERFAVSPGHEAIGYLHMPAGQSGHPMSGFYRAGHDDWVQGRPAGFLPGETAHTLVLKAAP